MGRQIEEFHKKMNEAVLPKLRWTDEDKKSLWNIPFSQWGDYFSLRKAKLKMMRMYAKRKILRKMPSLVPLYIDAINKNRLLTADYLQEYGGLYLARFVQNSFRRKYGLNSEQWKAFVKKEEAMWNRIMSLRRQRKGDFIKQQIMNLKAIPKDIRRHLVEFDKENLKQRLESYYHYQDGENRMGQKMPKGKTPPPTSLVQLEKER